MSIIWWLKLVWAWLFAWAIITKWYVQESSCLNSEDVNWSKIQVCTQAMEKLSRNYSLYYETKKKKELIDEFIIEWPFPIVPTKKRITDCLKKNKEELDKSNFNSVFIYENAKVKANVSECLWYN